MESCHRLAARRHELVKELMTLMSVVCWIRLVEMKRVVVRHSVVVVADDDCQTRMCQERFCQ
jgi:hypothetical protein